MISLGDIQTERRDGETVIPEDEEDKLLDKLADKVADRIGDSGVEIKSNDENPALTDVWMAGIPMGKLLDKALQNSREAGSSDSEPEGNDGDTGSSDGMLPIERMIKIREKDKDHPALPKNGKQSFDRSVVIYEHFRQWSKKTPKGRTITSGLKELLGAVTGTRLAWRQVYRAMDMVEEWTNGVITHEQTRRHGHVLVMSGQSSSVANG